MAGSSGSGFPRRGAGPVGSALDGVVAVVTGGGAGIGRGIAAGLAAFRPGWRCGSATSRTSRARGRGGRAGVRDRSCGSRPGRRSAGRHPWPGLGPPTVLVNNAGGTFYSPLLETKPKGWDALWRANLGQVLLCTQRVARGHGGGRRGRQHRQHRLDRGHPGRARLRRLRRGQGRGHQPDPHGGAGLAPTASGSTAWLRHHRTEGLQALAAATSDPTARFAAVVPLGRAGARGRDGGPRCSSPRAVELRDRPGAPRRRRHRRGPRLVPPPRGRALRARALGQPRSGGG